MIAGVSNEPSSLPTTVIIERRNRKLFAALAAAWLGPTAAGMTVASLVQQEDAWVAWFLAATLWFIVGLVTGPLLWASNLGAISIRKTLRIDREGLTIGGRRIDRDIVLKTSLTHHRGKTRVELVTGWGKVTSFLTDNGSSAWNILEAARLSAQHRPLIIEAPSWAVGNRDRLLSACVITIAIAIAIVLCCAQFIRVASPFTWPQAMMTLGFLLFLCQIADNGIAAPSWAVGSRRRHFTVWAITMAVIAIVLCCAQFFRVTSPFTWPQATVIIGGLLSLSWAAEPTILRVGTDEIALKWFWHERFIPHADVAPVEELKDGKGVPYCWLVLTTEERVTRVDGINAMRLASALKEAKRSVDDGLAAGSSALVRSESGSLQEWVANLRSIRQVDTLRRAAVRIEDLWALVEDATAPALQRAAAAVMLQAEGDEPTSIRLAEVAEATAMPKLRIALESAADDDDALIEALAELEAEAEVQLQQQREA